jgi:hypothetical protein
VYLRKRKMGGAISTKEVLTVIIQKAFHRSNIVKEKIKKNQVIDYK